MYRPRFWVGVRCPGPVRRTPERPMRVLGFLAGAGTTDRRSGSGPVRSGDAEPEPGDRLPALAAERQVLGRRVQVAEAPLQRVARVGGAAPGGRVREVDGLDGG